jgi:hypothetical protein
LILIPQVVTAANSLISVFGVAGGIFTGVAVAASAVYGVITYMSQAAERAASAFETSYSAYEDEVAALSDLETQLTDTTDKLKELYKIVDKDLTLTDKEDIANLEAEKALLEA